MRRGRDGGPAVFVLWAEVSAALANTGTTLLQQRGVSARAAAALAASETAERRGLSRQPAARAAGLGGQARRVLGPLARSAPRVLRAEPAATAAAQPAPGRVSSDCKE